MDTNIHKQFAEKILGLLIQRVSSFKGGTKYITYGDVAKRVDYPKPYTGNNFGKLIGETLGVMGHMFDGKIIRGELVPMMQALVVAKSTKLPGKGLKEFYPGYETLTTDKKRKIFKFGDNWLLLADDLSIVLDEPQRGKRVSPKNLRNPYGSEGSPEHRSLRDYIADHPEAIGLPPPIKSHTEYPLKSGDSIDVALEYKDRIIGIEVKSRRSGDDDLERGLYQCIKYGAVLKAEEMTSKTSRGTECQLVLEGGLTTSLKRVGKKLNVTVHESISPMS
ncbi:MAG: hypothetical protein IID15_09370, partial [Candidatus Marinimicrobia bacterium]|nr:hypothetical protein [Candidatus Neomarinimicrobiota bacterium]